MAKEERIFTTEEIVFCERLMGFGLVVDHEAKGIVTTALKNKTYDRLIRACSSDELLERLIRVLPKNDDLNSRYRFMADKNGIDVLERFAEEDFWERYSEEDFMAIDSQVVFTAPAILFKSFIDLCEDPRLIGWFGGKQGVLRFVNDSTSSEVTALQDSNELEYIVDKISFEDFMNLYKIFNPADLIAHPKICLRLAQLDINPEDWATNIYELNMLLYDLELVGFDTRRVKEVMFGEYKKSLVSRIARSDQMDNFERDRLNEEVALLRHSGESFGKKMKFESSVRAGFREGGNLGKVKTAVGQKDRSEFSKKWDQRIKNLDIAWLESADNPLRNLLPTLGYEIEFEKDHWFDMSSYSLAENVGFKKGVGSSGVVLELSPGPFYHHRTAGLTFLSFIDSGMIDVDRFFDQSVHLNIGFESKAGVISFMRILQMTGYAYNPVFNDEASMASYTQDGEYHQLRVRKNDQGQGAYVECKEFSLMSPSDFLRFLRCSQMLGAGLLSWQKIHSSTNNAGLDHWRSTDIDHILGNDIFRDDNFWMTTLTQKLSLINWSSRSPIEKELAKIYVNFAENVKNGLTQVGLNNFLTSRVEMGTSVAVVEELRAVFPDLYSRMTASAIDTVSENMIQKEGELYPNAIAFVRREAMKAVGEIELAMMAAEHDLASDLGEARRNRSIQEIWKLIKKHKNLLNLEDLSPVQKKQKLINLIERYKTLGWI